MRLEMSGAQFAKSEVARYEQIVAQLRTEISSQDQTINQLRGDLTNSLVTTRQDQLVNQLRS
jgi:hypothetical protein